MNDFQLNDQSRQQILELFTKLGSYLSLDENGDFQLDLDLDLNFDGDRWSIDLDSGEEKTNDNNSNSNDSSSSGNDNNSNSNDNLDNDPVVIDNDPVKNSNGATDLDGNQDDINIVSFENHKVGIPYDFEAQKLDWNAEWTSEDMSTFSEISNEEAFSGNQSLKITYPSDQQINNGAGWILEDSDEYYLQYQLKFAEDFDFNGKYDWSSGGKLPGLGADGLCSGGSDCTGENGFTSRPMWREDGRAVLYLYHMDKEGKYGDDLLLKNTEGDDLYYQPGQWHQITQRVKINKGNQNNGELEVWLDGEQVLDKDGLQFVNNGQQIDRLFFNTFHGGSGPDWYPDQDVNAYFDDFIVSTEAASVNL